MRRAKRFGLADVGAAPIDDTWSAIIEALELVETDDRRGYSHVGSDRLSIAGVGVRYGNRQVVRNVTMHVAPGEVVVLIGHNGCGKSSTLRAVFGLTPPNTGEIVIDGDIVHRSPHARRERGVAFVPATGEVFADLTVHENLVLAAGPRQPREAVAQRVADVVAIFDGLATRQRVHASKLSGGEQRMVGLGMALMTEPRLLLLDEPTKHLAPAAAARLLSIVASLARERSIGVLIAEVNVAAALQIADRVYVMRSGEIIAEHSAAELIAAGPATWWKMF